MFCMGWLDLANVKSNAGSKVLAGEAKVISGEPFRMVLAGNGLKALRVSAAGAQSRLEGHPAGADYMTPVLELTENGKDVPWEVTFE